MRQLYPTICCAVLSAVALAGSAGIASAQVEFSTPAGDVSVYDFVEITIGVSGPDVANPFTDASVQGTFGLEGAAPVQVDGFYGTPARGM